VPGSALKAVATTGLVCRQARQLVTAPGVLQIGGEALGEPADRRARPPARTLIAPQPGELAARSPKDTPTDAGNIERAGNELHLLDDQTFLAGEARPNRRSLWRWPLSTAPRASEHPPSLMSSPTWLRLGQQGQTWPHHFAR
jgi:hypothetical protein